MRGFRAQERIHGALQILASTRMASRRGEETARRAAAEREDAEPSQGGGEEEGGSGMIRISTH